MKKILELTKVFLKTSFSNMEAQTMGNNKSKLGMAFLYLFLIVYLGGIIVF